MLQNNAGYFSESVKNLFTSKEFDEKIKPVVINLNTFYFETDVKFSPKIDFSPVFVINNLISRGIPSRTSVFLEQTFIDSFSKTQKNTDTKGNISFEFVNQDFEENIRRAFYIINSKPEFPEFSQRTKKEKFKFDFQFNVVKEFIGEYLISELQPNITFLSLLENYIKEKPFDADLISYKNSDFINEKADFVISMPYLKNEIKGLIIDTDPDENPELADFILIEKKRKFAEAINFEYVYIKKGNFDYEIQKVQNFTYNEYFDNLKKNFLTPLSKNAIGRDALQIALSPFAIARIQKIILEFIISGRLNLNSNKWEIAVIERDIPAAQLAVEELNLLFENLFTLIGTRNSIPEIILTIYRTKEFLKAKTDKLFETKILGIEEFDSKKKFDLLIDSSIFQKGIYDSAIPENNSSNSVKIRSSFVNTDFSSLYSGENISYKPFSKKSGSEKANLKLKNSLEFFLQSIFRKEFFLENQAEAINMIFQNKPMLYVSPPATGKTLVYMFAALFQAGKSLVVLPDIISTFEKLKFLNDNSIDKTFFINSFKRKIVGRINAEQNFVKGNSIITFISYDMLSSESFKSLSEEFFKNKQKFSYLFVDEAQSLSLFHSDFNASALTFSTTNIDFLKKCPAISFTSNYSHEIEFDIKQTFNIQDDSVLVNNFDSANIQISIIDSYDGESFEKTFAKAFHKSFKRKEFMLLEFLANPKITKGKTIIVCQDNETISKIEKLILKENEKLNVKTIFPLSFTDYYFKKIKTSNNYWLEYSEFIKSKKNSILITNDNISKGFDFTDVDNILLFNYPSSPDKLYQLAGRVGRSSKKANLFIIWDKAKTDKFHKSETSTSNGEIETSEEIHKISVDKIVAIEKIIDLFPGRKKELTVIHELLDKILNFEKPFDKLLKEKIFSEFSAEVEIAEQTGKIYFTQNDSSLGYIDTEKSFIEINENNYSSNISFSILSFAKYEIEKVFGTLNNFSVRDKNFKPETTIPGIETQIVELKTGEKSQIKFSAENNIFFKTNKLIKKNVEKIIEPEILENIWNKNVYHQSFIDELNTISNVNVITPELDLEKKLTVNFYKKRDRKLTEISLIRLKTIRIIDSYSYNDQTDNFNVFFTAFSDTFYRESLGKYLSAYMSIGYVEKIKSNLDNYTGKTLIKKCVNIIVNFTYDFFEQNAYKKIDEIEMLINSLDTSKNPEETKQYFIDYFRNKFYTSMLEPSMFIDNLSFEKGKIDLVEKYIRKTGDSNLLRKHLLESSIKSRKDKPENYNSILLNIYCNLSEKDADSSKYIEELTQQFRNAEENEKIESKKSAEKKNVFLKELYERNPKIQSEIKPIFVIADHLSWLQNFNKKFLEGFNS